MSENAVSYAQQRFRRCSWKSITADSPLPFADGTFDVVISPEVTEHVFHVDRYLNEILRVLKAGETYGLTCPFHGFLKDLLIVLSAKHERHYPPYSPKSLRPVFTK